MLIDINYFFGDIQVGQLSEQSVQDTLELYIKQYEPDILIRLLGYATYKKLSETDQEWEELKTGVEYTDCDGNLCKWNGLYNEDNKVSLIAYYVYCQYTENQLSVTGGAGEGKIQMQNAVVVSSQRKILKAWNLMVDQNRQLYAFLNAKKDVYTDWCQWSQKQGPSNLFTEANSFGI